jgi:hypothetical protein
MYKTIPLIVVALLLFSRLPAQFQGDLYRQYNDAVVLKNANTAMRLPWTGGVNNPQLAMADLNQDGRKDLVVFENASWQVKTFIATGNGVYKYDSKYESGFGNIRGYIQLVDFNRDGIADLAQRGQFSSVSISYGYYDSSVLRFKHYKDLLYQTKSGNWNDLHIPSGSLGAFIDIDHDDDIDVLTYDPSGTSIVLYQNCSKDDNLPADSIKMCLKDWCWGRTAQISQRSQILGQPPCVGFHETTCKGCKSLFKTTDGSNALLMIDMDNDRDFDYFNGHTGFPDIQFLYNGKSQFGVDSVIAEDTTWSSNGVTMRMPILPAPFALDIDHDGDDDLLFTPLTEKSENYQCISWYENTGSNSNKNFVHRKNNHLVDEMIDMGRNSYPLFYDYDKDGKKDLFVGSEGLYQYPAGYNRSKVSYFRNTSSAGGAYSFERVSEDFMGLWAKNYPGAALAIGDLDNDSLDDLIIGHTDGTFSFYTNTAASDTLQPVWVLVTDVLKDQAGNIIDVGDYAAPAIYDIDGDGKKDLVSGHQFGTLYYFRNNSTVPGSTGLVMVTDKLGNVDLTGLYEPTPFTTPYFGPTDNSGKDYLVVGTRIGRLYRFDGFQNGAMPPGYTMIDSVYSYIDEHQNAAPAFANIDNDQDNLHELVLGNILGGLMFYKQDFKVNITDQIAQERKVLVYPNPADKVLNITWGKGFNTNGVSVQLISVIGQVVMQESSNEKRVGYSLDISGLSPGLYYCIIQSGPNRSVQPVTVLK